MEAKAISYWFIVSLGFTLTQPGAVAFANWDAPYGFYKDLSVWLSCAGAFLVLVTLYGLALWKREKLNPVHPIGAGVLATLTLFLGYWAEGFIRGRMGYGSSNAVMFLIGGFVGLFLALMILLMMIPHIFVGGLDGLYYPYDRPLLTAWAISLAISLVLLGLYLKARREWLRNGKAEALENHP
ncbi:hypothetical protein [Thermococcus sp.]|uniref:hypothetical protein n=1 Tax=Thermococcus sp. TaxID=35749 RepID=UPI002629201B|nr:hypothetical protein [Thermococcus sp.]